MATKLGMMMRVKFIAKVAPPVESKPMAVYITNYGWYIDGIQYDTIDDWLGFLGATTAEKVLLKMVWG